MTETHSIAASIFADAAQRVQRRLLIRRAFRTLLGTWLYAAGMLALIMILRLRGFSLAGTGLSLAMLLVWFVGCFAWAWYRRPDDYAALAHWDRMAGRSDDVANAWWFAQQSAPTQGQMGHIAQQQKALQPALAALNTNYHHPDVRLLAGLPLCALLLLFLPLGNSSGLPDSNLTEEGKNLARRESKKIAEAKLDAEKMKVLSEPEKKELEKLQQQVQDAAKALAEQPRTAREVLGQLEKSARDAERLAEKLAAGDSAWASEEMIAEMRKHADTGDLGDAVAGKSAENTGSRAQQIADKLRDDTIAKETTERFAETLRDIGRQAQPQDKERTVGQHVIAADKNLTQTLPKEAGNEFQALADKMKALAAREKAREQLEKLAQQLRESGSNVAGQGAGGMQQLAGNQAQQNQAGQNMQGQQMMTMPNAPQMQPPGSQNNQGQQGQGGQQQLLTMTPAQGNAQQPKPGQQNASPGDGKGDKNDKPMLFAPVPNGDPNQPPDSAIIVQTPGSSSGQQPGNAVSKMENKPTQNTAANQSSTVNAQRNADGSSSVRTVEGQTHNEQATRSAEAAVLNAISAEENALDDSALPPSRREQVRRYFTELRKRFEKQD